MIIMARIRIIEGNVFFLILLSLELVEFNLILFSL